MPSSVNLDNRYGAENDIVYKRLLRDNIIFVFRETRGPNIEHATICSNNVECILSDVGSVAAQHTRARPEARVARRK